MTISPSRAVPVENSVRRDDTSSPSPKRQRLNVVEHILLSDDSTSTEDESVYNSLCDITSTADWETFRISVVNPKFNINEKNEDGDTPLHMAVKDFNSDRVLLLLRYGANRSLTNKAGETPIQVLLTSWDGANQDEIEKIGVLLTQCSGVSEEDKGLNTPYLDLTPLERATQLQLAVLAAALIRAGADKKESSIVLHCIASSLNTFDRSMENLELLSTSSPINLLREFLRGKDKPFIEKAFLHQDEDGNTPVHILCGHEELEKDSYYDFMRCMPISITLPVLSCKNNDNKTPFDLLFDRKLLTYRSDGLVFFPNP